MAELPLTGVMVTVIACELVLVGGEMVHPGA